MHFKRLELVGFKSFFNKTTLHFEPGITAVVGPNGCGKSNIFDAIRWVLGEQSAKSLRGSEMQDVIFNGTDTKEPLSLAEVTLTFDNKQNFFNVDHSEVAITRRLFRSGDSEYLLNKTPVRLKDILDILLGTGIGAESYSIVAQGKIDLILSSRPEDRRLVFDEASGITKYKAQKRETTRRLEETEQNLLRVNDIIVEVKRQIGSLERQANKARRYKEVFEELKLKELNLSMILKKELLNQKNSIIEELKGLENKEVSFLQAIKEQEARISNRQTELKTFEENIMSVKNQLLNLENSVIRNNEHITFNKERIAELIADEKYLKEQTEEVRERIVVDEEKLNNFKKEYESLRETIDKKTEVLREEERNIEGLNNSIKGSLSIITDSKKDILDLVSNIANTKNQISDFGAKQQIYLARKKRLDVEKAKVFEEKTIAQDSLNSITQEVEALKRQVEDYSDKIANCRQLHQNEEMKLGDINTKITDLDRKKLSLESHKEFLEKLNTKYEGIDESMNAVIYLDKAPVEKVSGLVIKINDSISLSDEDQAYFEPASFKITGEAKPLELNTLKIEEKIRSLSENIAKLKNEKTSVEAKLGDFNKQIQDYGQELRSFEIALANKENTRQSTLEQFNKIKEEEDIIVLELQDLSRELSCLEQNLVVTRESLQKLLDLHRNTEERISYEESNISSNSKVREEILIAVTKTKTELDALNKRLATDETTFKLLEDTYRQDLASLNNIDRQINENRLKQEALSREIGEREEKIKTYNEETQKQAIYLKGLEDRYLEVSEGAGEVIRKIESDRREMDAIKNKLYELQMQDKDIDYKYSSIKTRMLDAYKIDLETMQDEMPSQFDMDTLAQEIEGLKQKLDSYGTVNLVAIEEYDELKKRYDFLISQQNDLLSAKESLHQAILKINRTTKQMFIETFEKVRQEFRNYFRLLFNGGDAQLFLVDEQDPLESGIEIICRPPGKKLQNVLLLSGGEKSMAAIALIFAIFKVKPSPFCVLDEIDAALDEANVGRFSSMLQEFAKQSQFIVITHNKKTIANANVMYGITMEESGVSKIVSVKLAQDNLKENNAAEVKVADAL